MGKNKLSVWAEVIGAIMGQVLIVMLLGGVGQLVLGSLGHHYTFWQCAGVAYLVLLWGCALGALIFTGADYLRHLGKKPIKDKPSTKDSS